MKKLSILLFCTLFISVLAFSQESATTKVPATVEKAFKAKFPAIPKVKWEKEANTYEAEFMQNNVETSAVFSQDGKWVETEVKIDFNALPVAVQQEITNRFSDYKKNEFNKITHVSKGVYYEVEIEQGKDKYDIMFDKNGKIIERKINTEK
ncbi:MAG: PepSY-like domain-containing protein [Bacteroidetes bacterium]|nr:PepSY-like domain-containing protein [Bacteroidota bacterium]